ncbi:MAG: Zn-ribbon domain-containing OB-fold protein [Dehalococcoidia bacterium]
MPEMPPKPLPKITPATRPFWEGTKQHKLLIPRGRDGKLFWYPRSAAPGTLDEHFDWVEVSGKGTVYSFTIDRRGSAAAFAADVPYVIAIVELAEGPHFTTNIVGCAVDDVHIGMPVKAVFEDVDAEVTLVKFQPEQR